MKAHPHDTLKQAIADEVEFQKQGHGHSEIGSPIRRWQASQVLASVKPKIKAGATRQILYAVYWCAHGGIAMPMWLAERFTRAFSLAHDGRVKSWDDAFGLPHPKGTHLSARRKATRLRYPVLWEIIQRHVAGGEPIDDQLFEAIGCKFDIGATLTKKYYKETRAELAEFAEVSFPEQRKVGRRRSARANATKSR